MKINPQSIAQYHKAGRGFLITRNSATLADTDYEHIAKEIVDALNKRHAYPTLVETLRKMVAAQHGDLWENAGETLLRELGEHNVQEKNQ